MSKKVLIVTYYWPPSGGSGVQRWLKFVKYLPEFGWTPYVLTPENPAFDLRDESLLKDIPPEAEVLRLPIWEPYRLLGKTKGKDEKKAKIFFSSGKSWTQKIMRFIRGNFFIPDPRMFWVTPASRFLEDFILQEKISHVVTTGPPHSMHLIGMRLKKKVPALRWVADFRDPWSEWHLLDEWQVSRPVRKIHQYLEKKVLTRADAILTVTPGLAAHFGQLANRKVVCITNGYDDSDVSDIQYVRTNRFTIRHTGLVKDARPFMEAVKQVALENAAFKDAVLVDFTGEVHPDFRSYVENDETLKQITRFSGYKPHRELPALYAQTDVLLLVIPDVPLARAYLPGKLFEYLAAKRPVIGLGPEDGDAAAILAKTGAGMVIEPKNSITIKEELLRLFSDWQRNTDAISTGTGIESYSRKSLTGELVGLLNSL